MDANGSRFHLLLGRDDWARCSIAGERLEEIWKASPAKPGAGKLSWQDDRKELTLEQRLLRFIAAPKDTFPSLSNRRGAARDCYGNWYWIDETQRKLRVFSSGSCMTSEFWPTPEGGQRCRPSQTRPHGDFAPRDPAPAKALEFSGLAVTEDHYLIVGVLNPGSLLIFDLHSGGEPRQLVWPESIPFAPFDMTAMPGGGVSILDRTNKSYWSLDRNFNVLGPKDQETLLELGRTEDFQPVDGSMVRGRDSSTFPSALSLLSSPIALLDRIAIEALPDGTVLILDYDPSQRFSRIYRYECGKQLQTSY